MRSNLIFAVIATSFLASCGDDTGSEKRVSAVAELIGRNFDVVFAPAKYNSSYDGTSAIRLLSKGGGGELYVMETKRCIFAVNWKWPNQPPKGMTIDFNKLNLDQPQTRSVPNRDRASFVILTGSAGAISKDNDSEDRLVLESLDQNEVQGVLQRIKDIKDNYCGSKKS